VQRHRRRETWTIRNSPIVPGILRPDCLTSAPSPKAGAPPPNNRENRNTSSGLASSPGAAAKTVRKVHTILAPKGGCGKTYVASLIAQALHERGEPVVCFDTDRENASLRDIPALKAEPVSLFRPNSNEIDIHAMDGMTERMLREDAQRRATTYLKRTIRRLRNSVCSTMVLNLGYPRHG
jgi:Mrp family chromosome partitioning ATPase